MRLKHLLTAFIVSTILAPAAMAKSNGGLRIKNVAAKSHIAGKAKKSVTEKISAAKPAKKTRKTSKRSKKQDEAV